MRFLAAPGSLVTDAVVTLDASETHHAEVRRGKAGDQVELLDGAGTVAAATIRAVGKDWTAHVDSITLVPEPTPFVLALGAGDRDRFLAVAQQCAELGITRLVPIETERSRQVETRIRESAVEKARRRVREASKQSGNPWIPIVDDLLPLSGLGITGSGVHWFFGDPGGEPLEQLHPAEPVGWVIGPEGGFSPSEVAWLGERLDARPIWLGPHILRFETAAVAAAVLTLQLRERARMVR
ncbi:MAG: RsmE family RNA methyltransferase [Gemmatimonadota bacterium]